jgi:hypothetical protein
MPGLYFHVQLSLSCRRTPTPILAYGSAPIMVTCMVGDHSIWCNHLKPFKYVVVCMIRPHFAWIWRPWYPRPIYLCRANAGWFVLRSLGWIAFSINRYLVCKRSILPKNITPPQTIKYLMVRNIEYFLQKKLTRLRRDRTYFHPTNLKEYSYENYCIWPSTNQG